MIEKPVIDIHCHLFNGWYALAELTAASWALLKGAYPRGTGEMFIRRRSFGSLEGIREYAAYTARLLDAALADAAGNYETEMKNFRRSRLANWSTLIVTPLMMDIYYALDNNDPGGARFRREDSLLEIAADERLAFHYHLEHVKELVAKELAKLPKRKGPVLNGRGYTAKHLYQDMERVQEMFGGTPERAARDPYGQIELSPGYRDHLETLEELALAHPGKVLPFLAVDPRRKGILQLMDMKLEKGSGVFKGVKLYPPQGYLPTHPNLEVVYDYCARYDIPITVHCSLGGFGNFRRQHYVESWLAPPHWETFTKIRNSQQLYYGDPAKWQPVLQRWPTLRINFGHLGGSKANAPGMVNLPWLDTIVDLMQTYPNVYGDLSHITNSERQEKTLALISQSQILKERVMFGTDFVMVVMDEELGGLDRYFTNFAALDRQLLYENASRFLKL